MFLHFIFLTESTEENLITLRSTTIYFVDDEFMLQASVYSNSGDGLW